MSIRRWVLRWLGLLHADHTTEDVAYQGFIITSLRKDIKDLQAGMASRDLQLQRIITELAGEQVADEYVMTMDHAMGDETAVGIVEYMDEKDNAS